MLYIQALINGILMGGTYGLMALGLSLIFGVLKIINFAHGNLMVVGMFIIYNSFSIAVVQRRSEIGILRALGATRRQIATLFLGESLVEELVQAGGEAPNPAAEGDRGLPAGDAEPDPVGQQQLVFRCDTGALVVVLQPDDVPGVLEVIKGGVVCTSGRGKAGEVNAEKWEADRTQG